MAKMRTKTISYRRAVWFAADKLDRNLEDLIREAHGKMRTVAQRKFKRADGQFLKGIKLRSNTAGSSGGYFLHIVAETPGDHASTLSQSDEKKSDSDVGTAPPPAGMEFMDGDILVYVKGNNVCICATVLREGSVTTFCRELFEKAKLESDATKFDLQKVANVDKIKMIKAQGVREIEIRATLYDATVDYVKRKDGAGMLGVVGKHINAVLGNDGKAKQDNLSVSVVLRADKRVVEGRALGEKRMKELASEIVEHDDDYVIITGSNQRITTDEIFVRTKVSIERYGKSVHRDKAWAQLVEFYQQLRATGATAQ